MNESEKADVCFSYDHEFGLHDEMTRKYIMFELESWLRALDSNGFKVVRKPKKPAKVEKVNPRKVTIVKNVRVVTHQVKM